MGYPSTVYKVFIASPSDVTIERNIIREVLYEWNVINSEKYNIVLLPIGWETHSNPAMSGTAQAILNKQILRDCDLLVGVFWTRVGTATDMYSSGTVEEIEEHIKSGKPTMLYFSSSPVHPDSIESDQYAKLGEFKKSCQSRGLYETYSSNNEFKDKFNRQLQLEVNRDNYFRGNTLISKEGFIIPSAIPNVPNLSQEANSLLKEAGNDIHGTILKFTDSGGTSIQTGSKTIITTKNQRTIALWEEAILDLEKDGLIEVQNPSKTMYKITNKGYKVLQLITT
jgi:predicted transcriptional regulator